MAPFVAVSGCRPRGRRSRRPAAPGSWSGYSAERLATTSVSAKFVCTNDPEEALPTGGDLAGRTIWPVREVAGFSRLHQAIPANDRDALTLGIADRRARRLAGLTDFDYPIAARRNLTGLRAKAGASH